MKVPDLVQNHLTDENGFSIGGVTESIGIKINWQNGPLGRGIEKKEQNGAFVGDVIRSVIGRLEYYQTKTNFKCKEYDNALNHLQEALNWMYRRTLDREMREIDGTRQV